MESNTILAVPSDCSLLNPNPLSYESSANLDLMNTSRLGETWSWRENGKIGTHANIKARTEGPESIQTGQLTELVFPRLCEESENGRL